VNALSEWLEAEVKLNGKIYHMRFERGITAQKLEEIGQTSDSSETGTKITFKPDAEIFEETVYHFDTLKNRIRELAFLNKGIFITLTDERDNEREEFHYEGGIISFVEFLNETKEAVHAKPIYLEGSKDTTVAEVALQYNDGYSENVYSFVNNINTQEGGTHLSGFKTAVTRAINDFGRKYNVIKENDENLSGEDVREGLTAVISVKLREPQFEGQTKNYS
jgi:DNA gyrase subunit B